MLFTNGLAFGNQNALEERRRRELALTNEQALMLHRQQLEMDKINKDKGYESLGTYADFNKRTGINKGQPIKLNNPYLLSDEIIEQIRSDEGGEELVNRILGED